MRFSFLTVAFGLALLATSALAQEADSITVSRIAICTEIADREPVGEATSFDPAVETLYCFTELQGGVGEVVHAWYQGDSLRTEIALQKGGAGRWRTWSTKTMPSDWSGEWRVDVLDSAGKVLESASFNFAASKPE